ncbi:MAG: hypothetical protein AABY18_09455 [Candidatus Thermoplasmatota archaeon]
MRNALPAIALALLLAGCTSPSADDDGTGSVTIITDPNQGRTDPTMGAHLHDYWGSKTELTVMDGSFEAPGYTWTGPSLSVAEFRPESGDVVPQGAAKVRVTVSWTNDDPTNRYDGAELWVKTAADSAPTSIGAVASGDTLEVTSTNERNDLPHQLLSAWAFQLVLLSDNSLGGLDWIAYTGTVTLQAVAVRGLDIPLYPGHPDQWQNRTEIQLVNLAGEARFIGETTTQSWSCFGGDCPFFIVPDNGTLVPLNADHVTIVLERETGTTPIRLGVKAHSAVTRDFAELGTKDQTDTVTTYTIPVEGGGDGPYAKQSQWEFVIFIDGPRPDSAVVETWHLTATAYKDA